MLDRPGEPTPSDPDWSGELLLADRRSDRTDRSPAALAEAVRRLDGDDVALGLLTPQPTGTITRLVTGAPPDEGPAAARWSLVREDGPGRFLLHADARVPGDLWLQVRTTSSPADSGHGHRLVFVPRGLGGILWWHALLPWRALALQRLAAHLEDTSAGLDDVADADSAEAGSGDADSAEADSGAGDSGAGASTAR